MTAIIELLASATFVEFIIGFLVIETAVLVFLRRGADRVSRYAPLPGNLAGICLLAALHTALVDAGRGWLVLALGGAFLAHAADVWLRMPNARAT